MWQPPASDPIWPLPGNRIPDALRSAGEEVIALPGDGIIQPDEVQVQEFLGGLLKSHSRKAA